MDTMDSGLTLFSLGDTQTEEVALNARINEVDIAINSIGLSKKSNKDITGMLEMIFFFILVVFRNNSIVALFLLNSICSDGYSSHDKRFSFFFD